eukprot:7225179-Prymnesium_polylepis.1
MSGSMLDPAIEGTARPCVIVTGRLARSSGDGSSANSMPSEDSIREREAPASCDARRANALLVAGGGGHR